MSGQAREGINNGGYIQPFLFLFQPGKFWGLFLALELHTGGMCMGFSVSMIPTPTLWLSCQALGFLVLLRNSTRSRQSPGSSLSFWEEREAFLLEKWSRSLYHKMGARCGKRKLSSDLSLLICVQRTWQGRPHTNTHQGKLSSLYAFCRPVVLRLLCSSELPRVVIKTRYVFFLAPSPEFLIQQI